MPGFYWVLEKGIGTQYMPAKWDSDHWIFIGDTNYYDEEDILEQVGDQIIPPTI